MARPPKSLLKDSHPEIAAEVVNQSLLPTLATGADRKIEFRCPEGHIYEARPYNRTNKKTGGTGCPVCNGKQILVGFNDLATTQPAVAAMCTDPEDALTHTQFSNKKISFTCPQGHTWTAPVARIVEQSLNSPHLGCPYCAGRNSVRDTSDLATTHPELVQYLVDPSLAHEVKAGSNKQVEWRCANDPSHTWRTDVYHRVHHGNTCPYCSGRTVTVGVNDLATVDPFNASRLVDPSIATQVSKHSDRVVEWRCLDDPTHTWENTVHNETLNQFAGCRICRVDQTSDAERDLYNVIAALVGDDNVTTSNRTILGNRQELDMVIEHLKVAVEYNGVYWHSEPRKGKHYHANKTALAHRRGYQLIHVWEDDYLTRRDVVIRSIAHKLGATDRVMNVLPHANPKIAQRTPARKLHLGIADGSQARIFLDQNHIQGAVTATTHFCLRDDDGEIRALLSVRSPRNNARMRRAEGEWEIQRYATCGTIPGGFTKLLKYAEREIKDRGLPLTTWISFASNDVSQGGMYESTGFVVDKTLPPDYKYVGNYTQWRRTPKEKFQKKRFKNTPELKYEEGWTEAQCAAENGLLRVYDSGKTRWIKPV